MAERIRVFHLIKSLGRGGAEMLLPEALRFADRERFDYSYGYFLPWKDAMAGALTSQDVEVTCFDRRGNPQILLAARKVAEHLRRRRIDVLHCHLPIAGAVGRVAGRLAGVPVVYTEHNKQERYHPLTRRLNALTWKLQAQAVAVSADVADSIRKHIPSTVPLQVVLNGVSLERFDRDLTDRTVVRRQYGIDENAPVIGTVAVFRTQKKLDDWLVAANSIHSRVPAARFLIVGDGPTRPDVTRGIAQFGLESVVHLPGLQEDVRPYLAAMDVYMMSSAFEGLPVAMLEAMSMRCVPVCTAVGGIPEVIRDGENGRLTAPGKPEELALAVEALIGDPAGLGRIGARARATVEAEFSMSRMARELEEIYLRIHSFAGTGGADLQAPTARLST